MNRKEMLRLLLNQAQLNGFDLHRWYQAHVRPEWPGAEQALNQLASENRHMTLLFSHEFAQGFWRTGAQMSFMVPGTTYPRINAQGKVVHVTRKAFTRRTIKPDVWKYHLRQMATADDAIEYLCRFLPAQEQVRVHRDSAAEPMLAQA